MKNSFWIVLALVCAAYLAFWAAMLAATATYTSPLDVWKALMSREIQYSTMLSLVTCTVSALLSLIIAVPIGYLMSRSRFRGHAIVDAALDIPIVLPPMVVGICLLIFFQTTPGGAAMKMFHAFGMEPPGVLIWALSPLDLVMKKLSSSLTYTVGGVIVAQFVIAAAFAIRTMRNVFDHLSPRPEDVAMTLGCTRWQAVWHVTFPAARRGMFAAGSIAWARSLGEFGPILVFAGATRMRTEVLPTSVWLAWSVGDLEQGVAVSLLMIVISMIILVAIRVSREHA
jgi:molybdate transport system permease protein